MILSNRLGTEDIAVLQVEFLPILGVYKTSSAQQSVVAVV